MTSSKVRLVADEAGLYQIQLGVPATHNAYDQQPVESCATLAPTFLVTSFGLALPWYGCDLQL